MSPHPSSDGNGRQESHPVLGQARDRLQANPYTTGKGVSCGWDQGVLRLCGRLPSYYHKQLAQEVVKGLDGVAEVVNDIEVVD
jgi:osmotically-inducible protein OsmY